MRISVMFMAVMLIGAPVLAEAAAVPRPVKEDSRVRVVRYDPNQVVEIDTSFGFATTVEFGAEQIKTVISGDTIGWQIVPQGNRLFIKPAERPQPGMNSTNVNVITDKRNYYLHLRSGSRKNPIFAVRFDYSQPTASVRKKLEQVEQPVFRPNNYNYSQTTVKGINVKTVFDDGQFTYFEFDKRQRLPAIYLVNAKGREELANTRREGKYVVVEKTGSGFSLRLGDIVKCIRNEAANPKKRLATRERRNAK